MSAEADGTVTRVGDGVYDLRFERRYALPIARLWAALTNPERLGDWLAQARIEPRLGGALWLAWPTMGDEMEGRIVAFDPPRLFAFTWPEPDGAPGSVVRWELSEEAGGCRLVMTNTLLRAEHLLDVGSGWHTHLDELSLAAERADPQPWTSGREAARRARQIAHHLERYRASFARQGAGPR